MREFTIDDLKRIMHQAGGIDSAADLNDDNADKTFAELDCDSLAVLEVVARIRQEYAVYLSDDAVELLETPRDTIKLVTRQLTGAAR